MALKRKVAIDCSCPLFVVRWSRLLRSVNKKVAVWTLWGSDQSIISKHGWLLIDSLPRWIKCFVGGIRWLAVQKWLVSLFCAAWIDPSRKSPCKELPRYWMWTNLYLVPIGPTSNDDSYCRKLVQWVVCLSSKIHHRIALGQLSNITIAASTETKVLASLVGLLLKLAHGFQCYERGG